MIKDNVNTYESHPGKTLISHAKGVVNRGLELFNDSRVFIAGLCHDVGKFINFNFRGKLKGENVKNLYTNHSYLSFYAFLNYASKIGFKPGIISNRADLILLSTVILKHHGGLPDFDNILNKEELYRMLNFLRTSNYNSAHDFLKAVDFDGSIEPFDFNLNLSNEDIRKNIIRLYSPRNLKNYINYSDGITTPLDFFFDLRMCFSAIVSADKYDAGNQKRVEEQQPNSAKKLLPVFGTRVKEFCNSFTGLTTTNRRSRELNFLRTTIREENNDRLKRIMAENPSQHVFSLTEPTGSGKTVMLMDLAGVILEEKFKGFNQKPPSIIYAVNYLSITEQVDNIIHLIFKGETDCLKRIDSKAEPCIECLEENEDTLKNLLKKYLRKILKGQTLKEEHIDKILYMDYQEQTFDYPMIVTTFVQLLQAFTTSSNKGLMKFSNLQNCIFLLDEIQSLPPRLYSFFIALIDFFCKKYNSYAIISTATMPNFQLPEMNTSDALEVRAMFRDYIVPLEIGNLDHFSHPIFNRYIITPIEPELTIRTLADRVLEQTVPTAVVLNTIRDSRDLYCKIKREHPDLKVLLLNTLLFSNGRTRILDRVKELLASGERFYLITTQVIEAGVDLDFDVVFRDIAPISNIIQTAGRCNRNGRLDFGTVYLFKLIDENGILRASYIYNGNDESFLNFSISKFFPLNTPTRNFEERELLTSQQEYFDFINLNTRFGQWAKDANFVKQINNFQYSAIGHFSLISKKDYGDQIQFYVPESESDDNYEKLIGLYVNMHSFENLPPKKGEDTLKKILSMDKEFKNLRKKMMGRVVQVNMSDEREVAEFSSYGSESGPISKLYKLKLNSPSKTYYDETMGLMVSNKGDLYV